MVTSRAICVGVFRDRWQADAAVDELTSRGFARQDISVVAPGREGSDHFRGGDEQEEDRTGEHDVGPGEGAAVGGLAGLLIGASLMLIPGVGPVFAVGPLAAGLAGAVTGAAAGAATGGIAAGLIHLGIPEEEADYYESRVGEGAYLVTVNCTGRYDEAREILRRHGADDRSNGAAALGTTLTTPMTSVPATHAEGERTPGQGRLGQQVGSVPRMVNVPATREETLVGPGLGDRQELTSPGSERTAEIRATRSGRLHQVPRQMRQLRRAIPVMGERLTRRDKLVQSLPDVKRLWPAGAAGVALVPITLLVRRALRARAARENLLDRTVAGCARAGEVGRRPSAGRSAFVGARSRFPRSRRSPVLAPRVRCPGARVWP